MMMMASVAEGCEARACGVKIRRLPVKNTGKQETVMSALPTVWGNATLGDLELNARSAQSQIDHLYETIHDLMDRVRSLEKKATAAQSAKRSGPAIAKPATKKAAKKTRV